MSSSDPSAAVSDAHMAPCTLTRGSSSSASSLSSSSWCSSSSSSTSLSTSLSACSSFSSAWPSCSFFASLVLAVGSSTLSPSALVWLLPSSLSWSEACSSTQPPPLSTFNQPKRTMRAVQSSLLPRSRALWTNSSAAFSSFPNCCKHLCTSRTASLSEMTSQIPSVARMTNSSASQSISWIVMSGSGFTMLGPLKSLSPRLLETARPMMPDTRRFWGRTQRQTPATSTTEPPSSSMRFFSRGRFGL
mmetsp:Transcript_52232/g.144617  ORF Transcript_52232/g.144617 Transcript_52232/m.144617 type:complete len:246 (-) Transcript_52232:1254-1991(-)